MEQSASTSKPAGIGGKHSFNQSASGGNPTGQAMNRSSSTGQKIKKKDKKPVNEKMNKAPRTG